MSGGSWNYVYNDFNDVAERLLSSDCSYRRALGRKVEIIAQSMRDIELADSGDIEQEKAMDSIKNTLTKFDGCYTYPVLCEVETKIQGLINEYKKLKGE